MIEHKESFNKELEELKAQVRSKDNIIETKNNIIETYEEDISKKDEEISKKNTEIVNITKERDLYKAEAESAKSELNSNIETIRYLDDELQQERSKAKEQCSIIEDLKTQLENKEHIAPFLNSISKSIDIIAESKANEKVCDFAKILVDEENKKLKEQHASDILRIKELEKLDLNIEQLRSDNRSLIAERANLSKEIEEAHKKIEKLEKENKLFELNAKKEAELKEKQFLEERRKLENELQAHKTIYSDFDKLYELYKLLPIDVQEKLQIWFGRDDFQISMVLNIINQKRIESFWQFICDRIKENELSGIDSLMKIFDIVFKLFRIIDNNYERLDIKEGESFNRMHMELIQSNRYIGPVQKVFFQGFKYRTSNFVFKQTLVSL